MTEAQLTRVTIRTTISTMCPNGGMDLTEVAVSWRPVEHVHAEVVTAIVAQFTGQTIWCEQIACAVADAVRPIAESTVRVTARQLQGHGVEAVAVAL